MVSKNHLFIGKIDVVKLARKLGTPVYIYNGDKIESNYREIYNSISYEPKQIHYAVMANNRAEILKLLLKLGSYLQVNSLKEYILARKIGFPNERISVTTTNISKEDMEKFIKYKALLNLDSIEEIEKYGKIIEKFRRKGKEVNEKIGIRVFVHVKATGKYITNKPYKPKARVGIKKQKFELVKKLSKKYKIQIIGIHGYLASNIVELNPHLKLAKYLIKCAKEFQNLEYINFGAGFGLPPKIKDKKFNWKKYGSSLTKLMKNLSKDIGRKINLKIEPGRSLVGDAGILLAKVTNIKDMDSWKEIGVDAGFGVFARPYIYNWKKGGYHPIVVANKLNQKRTELYTICANSVLQGDYLGEDRKLPKVEEGDIIAILNTGAYGSVMMSLFPGMRKPGEILIYRNKIKVIEKVEKCV